MIVDEIDAHGFEALQPHWDEVYNADADATVFCSWAWLRANAEATNAKYLVLGLRLDASSGYVAFFPFAVKRSAAGGLLGRRLAMAGNPLADYTGMVCLPEHRAAASVAFADHLMNRMRWQALHLDDVPEKALVPFVARFRARRFRVAKVAITSCPYIALPNDWETYVQTSLDARARQRLRRYMRLVDSLPGIRTVTAGAGNVRVLITMLLDMYSSRWTGKGEAVATRPKFEKLLHACFHGGCLRLTVQLQGETPVAALAGFVDPKKRDFSFYMMGWNSELASVGPGRAIVGASIRNAIEEGFERFDFLRGDEPYKFDFGAQERFTANYAIARPGTGALVEALSELRWFARQHGWRVAAQSATSRVARRVVEVSRVKVYRAPVGPRSGQEGAGLAVRVINLTECIALAQQRGFRALGLDEDMCVARYAAGDFAVMASLNGDPVGMAWCSFTNVYTSEVWRDVHPPRGSGYVYSVAVLPTARGGGVAPAMISAVMNEFHTRGLHEIWWIMLRSNASSSRAFAKVTAGKVFDVTAVRTALGSWLWARTTDKDLRSFLGMA